MYAMQSSLLCSKAYVRSVNLTEFSRGRHVRPRKQRQTSQFRVAHLSRISRWKIVGKTSSTQTATQDSNFLELWLCTLSRKWFDFFSCGVCCHLKVQNGWSIGLFGRTCFNCWDLSC